MNRIAIALIALVLSVAGMQGAEAQITLQCVKPGQELLVKPDGDTLWVINDERMRSVIETGKKYRISEQRVEVLTQIADSLNAVSAMQDSLISTLKTDRDYYITELEASRDRVAKVGDIADKYKRKAKRAKIGMIAVVVLAIGAVIFLK